MGLIGAKNINAFSAKTEGQRRLVKKKAADFIRYKVRQVLKSATLASPMWSGNYAYNWQVETSTSGRTSYLTDYKVEPWQNLAKPWRVREQGDPEIVKKNWEVVNAKRLGKIQWNTKIRLVNHAPVADMIEAGTVKLRKVNVIPGNSGVIAYLQSKYSFIR